MPIKRQRAHLEHHRTIKPKQIASQVIKVVKAKSSRVIMMTKIAKKDNCPMLKKVNLNISFDQE